MLSASLLLAFAPLAIAQTLLTLTVTEVVTVGSSVYTTTSGSSYPAPTVTATGTPMTHSIQVGPNSTLTFSPNNITAAVGDTVEFTFNPKNHTVTQSNFANPCEPLFASTGVLGGFASGFKPTNVSETTASFSFVVNHTAPIWGYCGQKSPVSHCAEGMVFSINAPTTGNNTFDAFVALAKATNSSASSTSASPSGSGSATDTASGGAASSTDSGTSGSGAISTPVNFGLTAVLAVAGVAIIAL